ncbi:phage tail tape measure protein [Arthrobacter sp. 7749]|nr:phage tail tape measure protein [Arthrobacter sp. 7749]
MSTRSVVVRLEAEIAGFIQDLKKAEKATADLLKAQEALGREIDKSSKQTDNSSESSKKDAEAKKKQADAAEKVGGALTIMGAATVAALGASTKAAMDWESAWAGVTKTVDGSPEQMAALEEELRGLAKTLPATHTEIAAVAEAAGQLGVAREDVIDFTKTMIDLSETTNLTADEAATSIAQFMNVMGTAGEDVDNLGAALVALGNDGASTEAEIISMAQRISGAGKLVGASESDVLALANALASVGIQAELGGGVTSRVLQRMYADVMNGGEGLQALADVAGTSGKEFATAFENDPVRALDMVVKGLSGVKESGGNVVETMKELGIKGTEETGVILRLAGAGDLLSESLDLGSDSWAKNTALAEEASKRYETTEAKVQIAWNNIKDAAIDAGASILPVVAQIAESVSGLAQTYGDLPVPVQTALTGMAGIVGVAALVGGAALTLIPKIKETRDAFRDLNESGSKIPGTMGKVAKGAAIAAAAYAVISTAATLASEARERLDKPVTSTGLINSLTGIAENGDKAAVALDKAFNGVNAAGGGKGLLLSAVRPVNDLSQAMDRLFDTTRDEHLNDFLGTVIPGVKSGSEVTRAAIEELDTAIAGLQDSGNTADAAASFQLLRDKVLESGGSIEDATGLMPKYRDAVMATLTANGETGVSQQVLTDAMLNGASATETAASAQSMLETELAETGVALNGVISDMDKFLEQLYVSGMLTRSERSAMRDYQASIDAVSESIKTNGASLEENTEKGRANQSALDGIAESGQRYVEALAAGGASEEELQAAMTGTYDAMIIAAGQFGITGDKADALARDIIGIPKGVDVKTWMSESAKNTAQATKEAIDAIPKSTTVYTHYKTTGSQAGPLRMTPKDVLSNSFLPQKADGGDLDMAPGPKGVDSQLFYGAKGEHVFTDKDVDAMGGQQAVYRFRASLHENVPAYANGGAIGVSSTSIMAANQVANGSSGSTSAPLFAEGAIPIYGATDAARVAQAVEDKIANRLAKGGWRI